MSQAATIQGIPGRSDGRSVRIRAEIADDRQGEAPTSVGATGDEMEAPKVSPVDPHAPPKRSKAKFVALGLALAALTGGGVLYAHSLGHESTDDAQVEGHVQGVSSRVSGQVAKVLVKDNQMVEVGDVLVELDPIDLQARVDAAKADVAAAEAAVSQARAQLALTQKNVQANLVQAKGGVTQATGGLSSAQATVDQAKADVSAAEARQKLAQVDYDRAKELFSSGAISKAEIDARKSTLDQADANLSLSRARLDAARANIAAGAGGVELAQGKLAGAESGPEQIAAAESNVTAAEARVGQAKTALHIAELNLGYAKITAPVRGVVSRRTVEVGQVISPDRALLAIVPLDDVWVVANFKEDQLAKMKPGQRAEIEVDAFGDKKLVGHVDSFSGGTGSRFALLPPDNASGNFVKVVQRVPTLVRVDDPKGLVLRPGMSAVVTVDTK